MEISMLRQLGFVAVLLSSIGVHANSVDVFKRSDPNSAVPPGLISDYGIHSGTNSGALSSKLVEKKIILHGKGLFDFNSHYLGSNSEQALLDLVTNLEEIDNIVSIAVVGHTDSKGRQKTNLKISEIRAGSVQAFLRGAYPDIPVSAKGMGESTPLQPNTTEQGRHINRRVEILVLVDTAEN